MQDLVSYIGHRLLYPEMEKLGYGEHTTSQARLNSSSLLQKTLQLAHEPPNATVGPEEISATLLDLSISDSAAAAKEIDFLHQNDLDSLIDLYRLLKMRLDKINPYSQKDMKNGVEGCLQLIYNSTILYYAPISSPTR